MRIKKINLIITLFVLIGLIIFVGADGNLSNPDNNFNKFLEEPQEEDMPEVEYLSLEDITEYTNEINSEKNQNMLFLEKETNQTEEENSAGQERIFEENSNIKEGISEEDKKIANETGQKEMTNLNGTEIPANHTDVRGNTQDVDTLYVSTSGSNQDTTQDVDITSISTSSPTQINTQEAGVDSSSLSVSSPTQNKESFVIDIDKVTNNTQDVDPTSESTSSPNNSINETFYFEKEKNKELLEYSIHNDGKEIISGIASPEIIEKLEKTNIKESKIDNFNFKLIISNEEHVENSFEFNYHLNNEVKEEQIRIFWENENNSEITSNEDFSVKYYDENDNGLIDKISWIVPHLSEQTYLVVITPFFEKDEENITLQVEGPNGEVVNPINFKINISYNNSENIFCKLKINNSLNSQVNFEKTWNITENMTNILEPINLKDGNYFWFFNCSKESLEIGELKEGTFSIDEEFNISNPEEFYFLDLVENSIRNSNSINILSKYNSNRDIYIKKDGNIHFVKEEFNVTNSNLIMDKNILNESGIYEIIVNFTGKNGVNKSINKSFYVIGANLSFTKNNIGKNEQIEINVKIFPVNQVQGYQVNFDENQNTPFIQVYNSNINQGFYQSYEDIGTKIIRLNVFLKNNKNFTVQKNGINVINVNDVSAPGINLKYPKDEAIFYELKYNDTLEFRYSISDDVKIQNCTFKLYELENGYSFDEEDRIFTNITYFEGKNQEVKIILTKFEEKEYYWEVGCFDNSSNYEDDWRSFEVVLSNSSSNNATFLSSSQNLSYENKEEIEETTAKINEFLINEDDLGVKEKEVLEALGISENMQYYKKRLIQIGQYFVENYKYVSNEELKKQKSEEYLIELENIKNSIPLEIKVLDSYEYVKNSVEIDLEEVVGDYLKSTNTIASKGLIKNLAKANLELQQKIAVSSDIKQVKIKYENETKEIILVTKTVEIKDKDYNQILEIIPKEIAGDADEIIFLVDNQIIKKDPIFEILSEDLNENNQIVYYIEKYLDIKKISKTETILFEDSIKSSSKVTGLFVLNILPNTDPVYFAIAFILIIFLIILAVFILRTIKIRKWKKEPNVVKMFDLLNQSSKFIKEKDLERAKEGYHEIQKVYPVLPENTKDYFYKKIKELLIELDKRDIFGLVREYEEAKRHWKKEDCLRIYNDIKKVYERLPEKYRKKVYERISKY